MKFLIFFTLFSLNTFAEYRVYQYIVTNKVDSSFEQPKSYTVKSTLNPNMYLAYHGGSQLINIDLIRTWRCVGNTSKKKICPSPYAKLNIGKNNENR